MASQSFYLPTRIIQGVGCVAEIGEVAAPYGKKALLVSGSRAMRASGTLERVTGSLQQAGVTVVGYERVSGEPTLDVVEEALALARQEQCELTIGLGGGSAMDVAKAAAGLFHLPGQLREYHAGRKLEAPGIPFFAIPTTAGTGAEVTNNAVLSDPVRGVKVSIRHEWWYARAALVDPALTLEVPPVVTATAGVDALSQALESYVSIGAMPLSDALCEDAIRRIGRSLVRAFQHGDDLEARTDMLYGSLMAGIGLTTARLGAIHGLAHPLGWRYHIPHGVVCGLLLPPVMERNLEAVPAKYARVAELLGVDTRGLSEREAGQRAIEAVRDLVQRVEIPMHLRDFGVREADWPQIIAEALPTGSTKFNPRPMTAEDLRWILERAM